MTDLISKIDKIIKEDLDAIQVIVNKYFMIIQDTKPEKEIPYLAYVVDVSVSHINDHHNDMSADMKAWSILVVRNYYLSGKLMGDAQIPEIIDGFVEFWKTNYEIYCNEIIFVTEYDRDRGFVNKYEKKIRS